MSFWTTFTGILENPVIFNLAQRITAPGAKKRSIGFIRQKLPTVPEQGRILDVACGPSSLLWAVGLEPIGLDISISYATAFHLNKASAAVGSALSLPFGDGSFLGVWSIGLLHHLTDKEARRAVEEMVRVCKPGGYVMVFDGVKPDKPLTRPLAWLLRRLDRGRHHRRQAALEQIFEHRGAWQFDRVTYSSNGLEGMFCLFLSS